MLVHGLCGAIGLWTQNIPHLCASNPVYAFDVLGFGRSSRPRFSTDAKLAEKEFVNAIDEWRAEIGLNKMILIGHSFGGYLITAYALQYPERVNGLVLVDPWGFKIKIPNLQQSLYIKFVQLCSKYFSPFSFIRATGRVGLNVFKRYRPDLKHKFIRVLGDSDIIYDYIYHSNKEFPR